MLAAISHLLADTLVSGTATLPHWEVRWAWPFSDRGWVFALVPWGDPGMTIIFVAGTFAALRWKAQCGWIAQGTLACVACYMVGRWLA